MLGREDNRIDGYWNTSFISQCYLAFCIRTQPGQHTVFTQLCLALDQSMSVVNRRGHQHISLVAGIAKHQALIAGTNIFVFSGIDSLSNITRLFADCIEYRTGIAIEANL